MLSTYAKRVFSQLRVGRLNSKLALDLSKGARVAHGQTGVTVRRAVAELVARGYPVCSGSEGFWLAATPGELIDAAKVLEGRSNELQKRAQELRGTAARSFMSIARNTWGV